MGIARNMQVTNFYKNFNLLITLLEQQYEIEVSAFLEEKNLPRNNKCVF